MPTEPERLAADPLTSDTITWSPDVDVADTVRDVKSFKGFSIGNGSTIIDWFDFSTIRVAVTVLALYLSSPNISAKRVTVPVLLIVIVDVEKLAILGSADL